MTSITTITQKGQITLPIAMRRALGWSVYDRVEVKMGDGGVTIEPVENLLDIAGMFKAPKGKSALKARAYMEKHYKRF